MNLTHDLSFLKEISTNDRKLISGGGFRFNRGNGIQINDESGSSSSSSSSVSFSSRNGVGSGRTSRKITVNGKVITSEDKSFSLGPNDGPISISIESSTD